MTIPYCIQISGSCSDAEIETLIIETFSEIHQIYNNWNPDSEISMLNRLPANQFREISLKLASFLIQIDSLVRLTEGRFDPTLGKGWDQIHIDHGTFWKEQDEITIDLCGVAKGYAVDLLVERLQRLDYSDIYVEWGGEIKTHGVHPSGRPWRVQIYEGPVIEMKDNAIATSGNYLQKWTTSDGITYTHLIDPGSQQHLEVTDEAISSASVQAESCMKADAIATALMLFDSQIGAEKWAQERNLIVTVR